VKVKLSLKDGDSVCSHPAKKLSIKTGLKGATKQRKMLHIFRQEIRVGITEQADVSLLLFLFVLGRIFSVL